MVATQGLVGLRPTPEAVSEVTAPPYDVIKQGGKLERLLFSRRHSLAHVTVGAEPKAAFETLRASGALVLDDEPSYYVYEQTRGSLTRRGVFVATEVTPYSAKQVIRHEKTFDDKVRGRVALGQATAHTFGPVFTLTRAPLNAVLERVIETERPLYDFVSDFDSLNDLDAIRSRVFRVPEASEFGRKIQSVLATEPVYIADGHHRYHAALKMPQTHALMYVTERAHIEAYDRVVRGTTPLDDALAALSLTPTSEFSTPPKHSFALYTRKGSFLVRAQNVPSDVVGGLDCSILEREVYPHLGLTHSMIKDPAHFDYYPESQIAEMKEVVDRGDYDIAIALHPVSIDELMAVADAGLDNPEVVMPEKSTFFAPKILSGLFIYRHTLAK